MRVFFVTFSLALVAGCSPDEGIAPVRHTETLGPAAAEATQDDIIGTYVVEHVEGAVPTINIKGHWPTITISAERIHFQSQCIYADWTYERDGEEISTKSYFEQGAMCARALAPGEAAIQTSFDQANTIRRSGERLFLEGGGSRLELRRLLDQPQRKR